MPKLCLLEILDENGTVLLRGKGRICTSLFNKAIRLFAILVILGF
jgi:hypothetical protein